MVFEVRKTIKIKKECSSWFLMKVSKQKVQIVDRFILMVDALNHQHLR
jgi:hypothetical protein